MGMWLLYAQILTLITLCLWVQRFSIIISMWLVINKQQILVPLDNHFMFNHLPVPPFFAASLVTVYQFGGHVQDQCFLDLVISTEALLATWGFCHDRVLMLSDFSFFLLSLWNYALEFLHFGSLSVEGLYLLVWILSWLCWYPYIN